jgi:LacI family transcriptional regulator
MKDIANATGFSTNTVSRALRNMPDISEETRRQIKEVSRQMGYLNNTIASSLRLGRTKTLAVIIPDVSNLFFCYAMEEIERAAAEKGYSTILLNTSEMGEHELRAIQTAIQKNVDGVIISPSQNSLDNIQLLISSGIPFVLLARYFNDVDTDYVVGDDTMGSYLAVKHLIDQGHRNILLLNGYSSHNSSAQERFAGYCQAHEQAGLPIQQDLLREVSAKGDSCNNVLRTIIQSRPDITAIFAFSDLIAWTTIDCLLRNGIRVPEDISIVGYDHIQAHLSIPFPLTTVDNYITRMAGEALDVLFAKMKSPNRNEIICRKKLPTDLYIGSSVKDIRNL